MDVIRKKKRGINVSLEIELKNGELEVIPVKVGLLKLTELGSRAKKVQEENADELNEILNEFRKILKLENREDISNESIFEAFLDFSEYAQEQIPK